MRFGKPVPTPPEIEPPKKQMVRFHEVIAYTKDSWQWSWKFEGEWSYENAKALFAKLTGPADAEGWIRNDGDDWAYRPNDLKGVAVMERTKEVAA